MNDDDKPLDRPDDATLSAWLDGELDEPVQAGVERWLQAQPEAAAHVRQWRADRDALRARFDPVLDEPVPPALLRTVRSGTGLQAGRQSSPWPRWALAASAAGILVAGAALGAGLVWRAGHWLDSPEQMAERATRAAEHSWPQRAAVAHAVYAPEVRHPVEVNVAEGQPEQQRAQEEHLARWLSKRLDMPVRLFDFSAEGFTLVGGRLLPDAEGPSAQLMYQNAAGVRVTAYLRRPAPGTATSFRFQREGELNLFYWAEEGYGCALVGKLSRERLLLLAESAYRQVEAHLPASRPRPTS